MTSTWKRMITWLFTLTLVMFASAACGDHSADDVSESDPAENAEEEGGQDDEDPVPIDMEIAMPNAGVSEVAEVSDVVVRGTVVDKQEDVRLIDQDIMPPGHTVYTVEIDETLAGELEPERVNDSDNTIDIAVWTHEDGRPIQGFESGGPMHLERGDEGYWFLKPSIDYSDQLYVKSHHYGVVRVDDDGDFLTLNPDSAFGRQVERFDSIQDLEEQTRGSG